MASDRRGHGRLTVEFSEAKPEEVEVPQESSYSETSEEGPDEWFDVTPQLLGMRELAVSASKGAAGVGPGQFALPSEEDDEEDDEEVDSVTGVAAVSRSSIVSAGGRQPRVALRPGSRRSSLRGSVYGEDGFDGRPRQTRRMSVAATEGADTLSMFAEVLQNFKDEEEVVKEAPGERPLPFRKLLALSRTEGKLIANGACCNLVTVVLGVSVPFFFGKAADVAVGGGDERQMRLARIMTMVFVLQLLAGFLCFLQGFSVEIAASRIGCRTRHRLFRAILQQDLDFFDGASSGELVSRFGPDMVALRDGVASPLVQLLDCCAQTVLYLVMMFTASWELAAMVLGMVVVIVIVLSPMLGLIGAATKRHLDTMAGCAVVAQETFDAMAVVRSYGAEELEVRRFEGVLGASRPGLCGLWPARGPTLLRAAAARFVTTMMSVCVMGAVFGTSMGGILWFGFDRVASGSMSLGTMMSFIMYLTNIGIAVSKLGMAGSLISTAQHAGGRIMAIVEQEPEMTSGVLKPENFEGCVCFQRVAFAYAGCPMDLVLHQLSFTLQPRSLNFLMGPGGSGKSTVLALLARLYDVGEGSIKIDGKDIRSLDTPWLRRRVACVPQRPVLFSMTIRENICYARAAHNADAPDGIENEEALQRAALAANADDFIRDLKTGYDTHCGTGGVSLSGGQKQRLAIARALAADPGLLLLDEATSALDAEAAGMVGLALRQTSRRATVLLVCQAPPAGLIPDRIFVLDYGQIVGAGTHGELSQSCPLYQRLSAAAPPPAVAEVGGLGTEQLPAVAAVEAGAPTAADGVEEVPHTSDVTITV